MTLRAGRLLCAATTEGAGALLAASKPFRVQTLCRVTCSPRALLALAALVLAGVCAAPAPGAATLAPYRGVATWVDIYDAGVLRNPQAAVASMASRGVRTVYLETANYRQKVAIRRPALVGRFVDAAHAAGLDVVAWYLPGFLRPAEDVRRSLAAVELETPGGGRFDGFALDIEASAVRSPALRTKRLLRVARELRAAVGPDYRLGAIIPSPRGLELLPTAWPGFPYDGLARRFDVFLPMVYFTYRTHAHADTRTYVRDSIAVLRREAGDGVRIHVIGGVADALRPGQLRGFVDAVCAAGVMGASLYDWATTAAGGWTQLARLGRCTPP